MLCGKLTLKPVKFRDAISKDQLINQMQFAFNLVMVWSLIFPGQNHNL